MASMVARVLPALTTITLWPEPSVPSLRQREGELELEIDQETSVQKNAPLCLGKALKSGAFFGKSKASRFKRGLG